VWIAFIYNLSWVLCVFSRATAQYRSVSKALLPYYPHFMLMFENLPFPVPTYNSHLHLAVYKCPPVFLKLTVLLQICPLLVYVFLILNHFSSKKLLPLPSCLEKLRPNAIRRELIQPWTMLTHFLHLVLHRVYTFLTLTNFLLQFVTPFLSHQL